MLRITSAAAVLCAVLMTGSTGRAAEPAKPGKLSNDELVKLFDRLGYDVKVLDKTFTQLRVERSGWTSVIRSSLSTDGTRVWLDAWFVKVNHPEDVPAATWR